jgi:hypothetical protein
MDEVTQIVDNGSYDVLVMDLFDHIHISTIDIKSQVFLDNIWRINLIRKGTKYNRDLTNTSQKSYSYRWTHKGSSRKEYTDCRIRVIAIGFKTLLCYSCFNKV